MNYPRQMPPGNSRNFTSSIPQEVVQKTAVEGKSLLQAWREYKKLTQQELAERMGMTTAVARNYHTYILACTKGWRFRLVKVSIIDSTLVNPKG